MDLPHFFDYSPITESLYIGITPRSEDFNQLNQMGVRLVINMRFEHRDKLNSQDIPLRILWLPTFDSPLIPIPLGALRRGVTAALGAIQEGGKVFVHCSRGRHRGVAMGAAILIAQGNTPEEAMRLIKDRRQNADPYIWYIRRWILKFAADWKARTVSPG